MKSDKEIRDYLDGLERSRQRPCNCGRTHHEDQCRIGGLMMTAVIEVLKWVLEENPRHEEVVETIKR